MTLKELYDNYDDEDDLDDGTMDEEELQELRLHYNRCPNCGRKMIMYKQYSEHFGTPCYEEIWECPNGCVDY